MAGHALVGPPAVALGACGAVAFGVFRALGAVAGTGEAGLRRVRTLVRVGLPAAFGVAFLALSVAGLPRAVDAGLRAVDPSLVGSSVDWAVSQVATGTASALVTAAAYLGAHPAAADARGADVSAATAAGRILRYTAGIVVAVVVLVQGFRAVAAGPAWGLAVLPLVGTPVLSAASGYLVRALHPTRAPTAAERERIEGLAAEAGAAVDGVVVSELADAKTAWLDVRGLPGRRRLFVTDYLLRAADDDAVRALLAARSERAARYWLEVRVAPLLALAAGLVATAARRPDAAVAVSGGVLVAGACGLVASGVVGRRIVFRADAAAAEAVGAGTLAAALERYADLNDADYEWGPARALLKGEPSLPDRLAALSELRRSAESAVAADGAT